MTGFAHDPSLLLKAAPPRLARGLLRRERLSLDRMHGGSGSLISVIAPTGFGKTSQLAQWRRESIANGNVVFWLTLDARDEPLRLVSALAQSAHQACAKRAFGDVFVEGLQRFTDPLEAMTAWLAETARLSQEALLIIDEADKAPEVTRTDYLSYLAGNAPANLRIAIGARPTRPVGVSGGLIDAPYTRLSADDLRFRAGETTSVLSSALGRAHDVEVALRLHELIEGWPLGVQLAVASLQRADDLSGFFAAAAADIRRFFVDQLIDRQPEIAKRLLISISPFELVHPELCVALMNSVNVRDELRRLHEQTPLLSVAEEGEWMRLHTMAREVLHERYRLIPQIERRAMAATASDWLEGAGLVEAAAEQALVAGLSERAYDMAEGAVQKMLMEGRIGAVLEWHQRLPDDDFSSHPGFWMPAAWALAMSERSAEVGPLLDRIEARPELSVAEKFEASLIRSTIAGFSDASDDLDKELSVWPEPPPAARAQDIPVYWISRGLASLHNGRPDQARVEWLRFDEFDRSTAYTPMSHGFGAYGVGLSHLWEGRCALAEQVLRPALGKAEVKMGRRNLVTCMLAALLARASWEGGRSSEPAALLALRLDVIERQGLPDALLSAFITLARVADQEGRHDKAMSLLEELRAFGIERRMPRLHFAAQCEMVRQHNQAGRSETADVLSRQLSATFATHHNLFARASVPWLKLQLEIAIIHAGLAQPGADHISEILDAAGRAAVLATDLKLGWEAIELRLLRSLALERIGDPSAVEARREALSLAQANGQMRLAAQYGGEGVDTPSVKSLPSTISPAVDAMTGAILTIKEREILALLVQSLSNKEIALALGLSEQTVKWHLKNLFQKLDGANRKHAVARARMLGLIPA